MIAIIVGYLTLLVYQIKQKGQIYSDWGWEDKNFKNISGVIVEINDYDKNLALEKYTSKGFTSLSNLVLATYADNSEPEYYYLLNDPSVHKIGLLDLNPKDVIGRCVYLYAMSGKPLTSEKKDYIDKLQMLFIRVYRITDRTNCYENRIPKDLMFNDVMSST
ncbi:hypothetical protein COV58_02590 [Candidatus Roizmanbacteria bacterium CG11_big_fil_rev_8_21_14_0_20_36_8]|uniref:Uncharacterized protein n=2 Tax=Candidatus Roizmaniibacteriota TaxID=1752723 RepID=A0A2M6IU40_9BACT|nr:MAG: hypothetical protein COV58_02590 [Candidatus Roizmanbacteria bacterium CG11_big_fil_rev_8_21_14_0_20_36_8]PIZ64505.1 MAG: hypothetical protein COY14_04560 [Candidatus Roizmanbacteria bacterium CG_4_10_14_0_2_um_filter_36_9]